MKRNICIQICADNEWDAVKQIFSKVQYQKGSERGYEYIINLCDVFQCIYFFSGASKTYAAAGCQFAIQRWNPYMLFVAGSAGGVGADLKELDLVIANQTVQYDCISRMGDEIQLFYKDFIVDFDNSWIIWDQLYDKLLEGLIATADQDIDYALRNKLQSHGVLAADWESGAIAPICLKNQVPCCIIRGITDVPVEPDSDVEQGNSFRKNTPGVMQRLILNILPALLAMIEKSDTKLAKLQNSSSFYHE